MRLHGSRNAFQYKSNGNNDGMVNDARRDQLGTGLIGIGAGYLRMSRHEFELKSN